MKKVLVLAIFLLSPALVLATQWGIPQLCPGVNTALDDFSVSISSDGDIYKVKDYLLWKHEYLGSYNWSSDEVQCTGLGYLMALSISPDQTKGVASVEQGICLITSSNGIAWSIGEELTEWNRLPDYYPISISCAWESVEKWLYVNYSDGYCYGAPYPYTSPVQVDLDPSGDHMVAKVGVALEGNYMVVSDSNGLQLDLYELTGSGSSWSGKTEITEVNNGYDEQCPVLGVVDGKNILLFSRVEGDMGGYDVWYSVGDNNNFNVQPTSLGSLKAMYH